MKRARPGAPPARRPTIQARLESFLVSHKWQVILAVIILTLVFDLLLFDPKLSTGGDNATYISLAESIASGKGYRSIYFPDQPPHTQYPFGFPLMLVPFLLMFGHNYIIMKLMMVALGLGIVYFLWRLLSDYSEASLALALGVVAMTALNPDVLTFSHWLFSEIPFLFFTVLGIFLFERGLKRDGGLKYLIPSSMAFAYTSMIRPPGLALLAAGFVILLVKKRVKFLVIFTLVGIACVLPWTIRNARLGSGLGMSGNILMMRNVYDIDAGTMTIPEFISRFLANIRIYGLSVIPETTFYFLTGSRARPVIEYLFAALALLPALYGYFYRITKRLSIMHVYVFLYLLLILPWHEYVSSVRYLLPMLPFLFYFLAFGLAKLGERAKWRNTLLLVGGYVLFMAACDVGFVMKSAPKNLRAIQGYLQGDQDAGYPEDWVQYYRAADWVKANTPSDAVVVNRKPELFYLRSHRRGYPYPYSLDHAKVAHAVLDSTATYIVVDQFRWTGTTGHYLVPVLQENQDRLEVVYRTPPPETYVLKIKK